MEQVKRTRIPSLPLKNILNDTDHAQKIFCEGLRTDGFVVLNIEECKEEMELMNKFRCVIRDYFSQSNNKQNGNFEHDIGYVNVVNSREIFQVRLTNALQWPSDEFKNIATDWYQLMTRITRQFLDIIAISLGKRKCYHPNEAGVTDTSKIWDPILDAPFDPATSGNSITTSLLRIIHYYNKEDNDPSVYLDHHCDIGLITFLPVAEIPGLEGLTYSRIQTKLLVCRLYDSTYIDIEACALNSSKHIVVIAGEILHYMSKGIYRATLHRVVCKKPGRISFPFLAIPRPDVTINPINNVS